MVHLKRYGPYRMGIMNTIDRVDWLPSRKEKKNYASSRKLLTSIKEKGPLGKKSPFTRKEESSQ